MMDDDRGGGLFGFELEFFGQLDADSLRLEQFEEFRLIFEIRARGVAEAVARALIALMEKLGEFGCVRTGDAEFFADALVPQLG